MVVIAKIVSAKAYNRAGLIAIGAPVEFTPLKSLTSTGPVVNLVRPAG
jgi:hypothetical protein